MENLDTYILGQDSHQLNLQSSADNVAVTLAMLRQTRRTVDIFSRQLDGRLYDKSEFITLMGQLASRQPRVRIRILLKQVEPLVSHNHRIIELSRKLSSSIHIRLVHENYKEYNQAFMIFDDRGVIKRQLADRYEGIASFNDPMTARPLGAFFDEVWEISQPDPNLRRLYI
ncbi:MAG: hypothetical protein LJE74_10405 [Proteobacteria bacterium]|jgi:hypothetical protein|nr:hypothetical protein [Pseudomonadota bacterium]MCG6936491.1 hypothetical protein [Pseudomonadota bacterium]